MTQATLSGAEDQQNYQGVEVRASTTLTASVVYTQWMDVRTFEAIDWVVYLTAQGSITRLDFLIQWTVEISPNDTTDWAVLQSESIDSSGIATLSNYQLRKTISGVVTLGISSPCRGRFMRLGIFAGVGSPTNSLCSIDALRRKQRRAV